MTIVHKDYPGKDLDRILEMKSLGFRLPSTDPSSVLATGQRSNGSVELKFGPTAMSADNPGSKGLENGAWQAIGNS